MINKINEIINKIFGPMADNESIATILADYSKRILENKYTDLLNTPFGKKLKAMGVKEQNVLEFIAYTVAAVANKKLPDNTVTQKTFKQVAQDFAPEIMKRIRNHSAEAGAALSAVGEKNLIENIFELGGPQISQLIEMLNGLEEPAKSQLLKTLAGLSPEKIKKVSKFTPEKLNEFNQLLQSEFFQTKSLSDRINANMNPLRNRLKKYIAEHKPERGN